MASEKITDFGFEKVAWDEKEKKVGEVFQSVAQKYDLMNDLMSFGIHRLWKRITVELACVRRNSKILDLAGGSGDISMRFCKKISDEGRVVLADINPAMLKVGRDRIIDAGYFSKVDFAEVNAEYLPFKSNYFDYITIGFGLRNVTDKLRALKSMYRVCKPSGKLLVLEFSKPTIDSLQKIYDWYSFNVLPKIGKIFANDSDSYKYLAESIRMHPDQEDLKQLILDAGFEDCKYINMSCGIVALHIAYKY